MKRNSSSESSAEAEIIALNALRFLAAEPERLQRFLDLSGLTPAAIRQAATDPGFLAGILDHLLQDQSLLLNFCEEHGLKPEGIMQLRRKLPGAAVDF